MATLARGLLAPQAAVCVAIFLETTPARANVYVPIDSSYVLVFDDEFNATSLNTAKWYPPVNQQDFTYNNVSAEMLVANVSVHDGVLDLAVTPGPTPGGFQYGTAALTSRGYTISGETVSVYWEARILNMDNAIGLASDYWTDKATHYHFPEVDFSEYWQSQSPDSTRQNYNSAPKWVFQGNFDTGSNLAAAYHVYGCLWTPTAITWYIDGIQTAKTTNGTNQNDPMWYAILNAAVMGNLAPTTVLPNHLLIDYVHVYSAQPGAVAVTPDPGYGGPGAN